MNPYVCRAPYLISFTRKWRSIMKCLLVCWNNINVDSQKSFSHLMEIRDLWFSCFLLRYLQSSENAYIEKCQKAQDELLQNEIEIIKLKEKINALELKVEGADMLASKKSSDSSDTLRLKYSNLKSLQNYDVFFSLGEKIRFQSLEIGNSQNQYNTWFAFKDTRRASKVARFDRFRFWKDQVRFQQFQSSQGI